MLSCSLGHTHRDDENEMKRKQNKRRTLLKFKTP